MPTIEQLNGKPVYAKEGDAHKWLFFAKDMHWWISNTVSKEENMNGGFAYSEEGLAHPGAAKSWRVYAGGGFEPQPVNVTAIVSRQLIL